MTRRASIAPLLQPLLWCALAGGCSAPRSVVRVTLTSDLPVTGIDHFVVDVASDGVLAKPNPLVPATRPYTLPPPYDFTIGLPADRKGTLVVSVDAESVNGDLIATAAGEVVLAPGKLVELLLRFGAAERPDLGAPDAAVDLVTVCEASDCNCAGPADCPPGRACDTMTRRCGAACGAAQHSPCNGGCCAAGSCVGGGEAGACGGDGKACTACSLGTPSCVDQRCTTDCVVGQGGANCGPGFCCRGGSRCAKIEDAACGLAGGACVDCGLHRDGPLCQLMTGTCGCKSAKDCPLGQACKGGACGDACSAMDACNGGCCDPRKFACADGTDEEACSLGANLCGSCAASAAGRACLLVNNQQKCGCNGAQDCALRRACDATTRTCTDVCGTDQPCNGGCCTAVKNGVCQPGTAEGLCGANGGLCGSCPVGFMAGTKGKLCIAAPGGGSCGCTQNSECPPGVACDNNTKTCSLLCSNNLPCAAGCCLSGTCRLGTSSSACAPNGMACSDCTMSPQGRVCLPNSQVCGCNLADDCPNNNSCNTMTRKCETICGDANHGPCNGGCCAAGKCVAGTSGAACGMAGRACLDCAADKSGRSCVAGACGCAGAADCAPRFACNLKSRTCDSTCGDAEHSGCSGSCCLDAQRVCGGGPDDRNACGAIGGSCVGLCKDGTPSCAGGQCVATCGAPPLGQCSGGFCCSSGKCATLPAACQTGTDNNAKYVVCDADCKTAWLAGVGGARYYIDSICKSLGYTRGAFGSNGGSSCGFFDGPHDCTKRGIRKFDNNPGMGCGMTDAVGFYLCGTPTWECIR